MCGLFGFVGARPDAQRLALAALEASRRGPHAFGWAIREGAGALNVHRQTGRLDEHLGAVQNIARVLYAPVRFIGQARLATSGAWQTTANNQPLLAGDLALVHNGNVYNDRALFAEAGYTPTTENDSEAILAVLMHYSSMPLQARAERVIQLVDRRSPLAALVSTPQGVAAIRRGHPLYVWEQPEGVYLCSRPLGTGSVLLPDNAVTVLGGDDLWPR